MQRRLEVCDCPTGTVRSRVARARADLLGLLQSAASLNAAATPDNDAADSQVKLITDREGTTTPAGSNYEPPTSHNPIFGCTSRISSAGLAGNRSRRRLKSPGAHGATGAPILRAAWPGWSS